MKTKLKITAILSLALLSVSALSSVAAPLYQETFNTYSMGTNSSIVLPYNNASLYPTYR